jgi:hypothetical protein
MTTGNTVALTVNVGAVSPPKYQDSDCQELKTQNETQREKTRQNLSSAMEQTPSGELEKALSMVRGNGSTFTSARVDVGSPNGRVQGGPTGCSNGKARERGNNAMVKGGSTEMKNGDASVMCKPPEYKHAKGGSGAHAEAKIMNELTELGGGSIAGGSVLLNVDWRYRLPSTGKHYKSGMPCPTCYRMLCHASKNCGVKIFLCDKDGKPQELSECGDPDGYTKLDEKIDKTSDANPFKKGQGEVALLP